MEKDIESEMQAAIRKFLLGKLPELVASNGRGFDRKLDSLSEEVRSTLRQKKKVTARGKDVPSNNQKGHNCSVFKPSYAVVVNSKNAKQSLNSSDSSNWRRLPEMRSRGERTEEEENEAPVR